MNRATLKGFIPKSLWNFLRERSIVRKHARVAQICNALAADYISTAAETGSNEPKVTFPAGVVIIWQYWAQGFDDLPTVVRECFESVDRYAAGCLVIRLSDRTVGDYLDLPEYVLRKKESYGYASFSDLLRVMLLNAYGGVWIDATVMLSAPIPEEYLSQDFFAFQRDTDEPRKDYWKNTYAYYFSWAKGFRVNFLSSFMVSKAHSAIIQALESCLLKWWKEHPASPDYFFLQILFDVLVNGCLKDANCPVVSDCPPHYLQQLRNDPNFFIKSEDEVFLSSTIHKLTYK